VDTLRRGAVQASYGECGLGTLVPEAYRYPAAGWGASGTCMSAVPCTYTFQASMVAWAHSFITVRALTVVSVPIRKGLRGAPGMAASFAIAPS